MKRLILAAWILAATSAYADPGYHFFVRTAATALVLNCPPQTACNPGPPASNDQPHSYVVALPTSWQQVGPFQTQALCEQTRTAFFGRFGAGAQTSDLGTGSMFGNWNITYSDCVFLLSR